MQARFDKHGRQLPDTGHGCGCGICEESGAPRYERRLRPRVAPQDGTWSTWRRLVARVVRGVGRRGPGVEAG